MAPGATGIDHEVVVIGAGFSGIGTAAELERNGFRDYLLVDQSEFFANEYW